MRDSPTVKAPECSFHDMNANTSAASPPFHTRRLFIGDLPKNMRAEEVKIFLKDLFPEAAKTEVYADLTFGPDRNRGFAFVECLNHIDANACRERVRLNPPEVLGRKITCDWAQLENAVSEEIMKTVKVLFLRNIHPTVTEEQLYQFCGGSEAGVEKVKKQKMYAFVHFQTRRQAAAKLEQIKGSVLCGLQLEVVWSKPKPRVHPYAQTFPALPMQNLINIPPQPQIDPLPSLLRSPDYVYSSTTLTSTECLVARPSLLQTLQSVVEICNKAFFAVPLLIVEVFYLSNGITLIPVYRGVSIYSNGLRIEGDPCLDSMDAEESALSKSLLLLQALPAAK